MGRSIRFLLALAVTAITVVALAGPALAQIAPDGDVSPDTPVGTLFTINNLIVTVVVGTVLPLLNGFLLRETNPRVVKTLVAALVATGAQWISQIVQDDGTAVFSQEWLLGLAGVWTVMILSYYGLWKPTIAPNTTLPTVAPVGDVLAVGVHDPVYNQPPPS